MGAWIEIIVICNVSIACIESHPTMGAWIEIKTKAGKNRIVPMSHPTMGAWIEIGQARNALTFVNVAPHDGCVD